MLFHPADQGELGWQVPSRSDDTNGGADGRDGSPDRGGYQDR
jgi:hypothetical protein